MKQIFLLLLGLLLLSKQAYSQKVVKLQTFDFPDSRSGYLFAGNNFYLNKDTYFNVLNLNSGSSSVVTKPAQPKLEPGITFGALGTSVIFTDADNQGVYVADNADYQVFSGSIGIQQIVTGKNSAFMIYLDPFEGFKMIEIDNSTYNPKKFWITGAEANLKMEYDETEDLIFFSNTTSPNTVALYVSDGDYSSTVLLSNVEESADETISNSFFLNNGSEIHFVNITYLNANPSRLFSHVYKLSESGVTNVGSFTDFKPYPNQNFVKNNVMYGYNTASKGVVKSDASGSATLLPSENFVSFEGEYNAKVLFTIPSSASTLGDSLVTLYETDGTATGTRAIADKIDAFFKNGDPITVHKGMLYFIRRDEAIGAELFKYDGQHVSMVEDVVVGPEGLQNVQFYVYEDELYFTTQPSDNPKQLNIYKLSDTANTIHLSAYADLNANGTKDTEEPYLLNQQFSLNGNGLTVFSNQETISLNLEDGSYTLSLKPTTGWTTADKTSTAINLPEDSGKSYSLGLTPEQETTKVDASLMSDASRCGFPTTYMLHYSNNGFTEVSGTIKLKPEAKFNYESALPAPSEISADTLIWYINELGIGQKGKITLNFTMPGVENIGDTLISELFTNFRALHNATFYADTTTLQQILTCSYDPNDIQANPAGLGEKHLTLKNQVLEYLIRFQNMGTDKAFNIVVKNVLQEELDLSSFQVIGSSHNMYTVIEGNELSFHFDNIELPDDKADEPGSHGYILYRIKPVHGLPDSTIINNLAFIYFDYNPAIETNIAYNTLVDKFPEAKRTPLGLEDEFNSFFTIYPNPAKEYIKVFWKAEGSDNPTFTLHNSVGQQAKPQISENKSEAIINLSKLAKGLYFLKVSYQNKVLLKRIMVQ
ncbi:T9SS type A sorting domain-containing protein [Pontibacter silvestris]|uniref:T9SS type A sorting domain-containing protein n=1 Tax=Pontibacter silvestris TaxID=2305183 RepID=A0ABW4X2F6_9BACT|nr:T9SS type A sorting domain-containing protein [Pontibacter silvestris]MCC9134842.1 T9SS type A sorting domain-containing protein [Pontibacter silvestris]